MATYTLDFERPLLELERQIEELKKVADTSAGDLAPQIRALEDQLAVLRAEIYKNLTPMQRVQVARHPRRPYALDYLRTVFTDFVELHGDRLFRDDPAIVGGWARLEGETVMVIGHQKGRDTKENLKRNFGMAHPDGYRKALRLMKLAEKFGAPVVTLVDTPGAYPGLGAEERDLPQRRRRRLHEHAHDLLETFDLFVREPSPQLARGIAADDRECCAHTLAAHLPKCTGASARIGSEQLFDGRPTGSRSRYMRCPPPSDNHIRTGQGRRGYPASRDKSRLTRRSTSCRSEAGNLDVVWRPDP